MIDISYLNKPEQQVVEFEMKTVANPQSGFLTPEERIQRKILRTLLSASKVRDNNIKQLYLVKFIKNADNEVCIVIHLAKPIFDGWKFKGWDTKGCMKNPHFYIQEVLEPDPQTLKILKRRLLDTTYNLSHIKHYLKGFHVQEIKHCGSSDHVALLYRTVRKAKNLLT